MNMDSTFDQAQYDIERTMSRLEFAAALRELADCIEQGRPYSISVNDTTVETPVDAALSVEYECDDDEAELEFQLKWTRGAGSADPEPEGTGEHEEEKDAVS
jgi:amphi-Trp domain-containing protein